MADFGKTAVKGDSLMRGWLANPGGAIYSPVNRLGSLLSAAGHSYSFVGTEKGMSDPGGHDVTAVGGWKISDLDAKVSAVGGLSPDTVIVSIGTNNLGTSTPNIGTQITNYLNNLYAELGSSVRYFVFAPVDLSWFDDASYTLLVTAMQTWCAGGSLRYFGNLNDAGLSISGADGNGDGTHWSEAGANKVAAYIFAEMEEALAVEGGADPTPTGVTSELKGFDLPALMTAAGAKPVGEQKAKLLGDIVSQVGANPLYKIVVGDVDAYRASISGSLPYTSAGIALPTQFTEPPAANLANALTAASAKEVIQNATNAAVRIETPIKATDAAGFLRASKALNGTYYVRTSSRIIRAPSSLDVGAGGGGSPGGTTGIYSVSRLIADMNSANYNEWHLEAAPNTANTNGPSGRYAYVVYGLRRTDGNSYWPGEYLSDSSLNGKSLSDSTAVGLLPWYVIGRAKQVTEGAGNTRVQMRAHKLLGLKQDNTWEVISTDDNPFTGASWHANFRSPGLETLEETTTGGGLAQIRSHSASDGGGESIGSIGYGNDGSSIPRRLKWAVHGYNNATIKTRAQWVAYKGLLVTLEARLVLHDPNGTDDRANAGLLMWIATGDWYKTNFGGSNWIGEHAHGRLDLITRDWKVFSASEISSSLLTSYPPPGFS